jgi:HD-GYP domain-containing protein (c-di-GMP phosphodiesterase class II)
VGAFLRLGLVRKFALSSLLMVVLFALALGFGMSWVVRTVALTQANASLAAPIAETIRTSLTDADFAAPLSGSKLAALDAAIRRQFIGGNLVGLKITNASKRIIYSTVSSEIGSVHPDAEEIGGAFAGRSESEVENPGRSESPAITDKYGPVAEGYNPYRGATGAVIGVAEVYQRYAPIAASISASRWMLWAVIAVGALLIYVGQVSLVYKAEREREIAEAAAQAARMDLELSLEELAAQSLGSLHALVAAVDAKDSYTAAHSSGVTEAALAIGRRMGLSEHDLGLLESASLLHDVGKIGVPGAVLSKPSALTPEEFRLVQAHPALGGRIAESVPSLEAIVPIIVHHHERWDGTGYPDGLSGEEIPVLARVLAVADAYDAMSTDRPYRGRLAWFRVRKELRKGSGTQFDPRVIPVAIDALRAGEIGQDEVAAPAAVMVDQLAPEGAT